MLHAAVMAERCRPSDRGGSATSLGFASIVSSRPPRRAICSAVTMTPPISPSPSPLLAAARATTSSSRSPPSSSQSSSSSTMTMTMTNKNNAVVRHVEKRRTGTCRFSDRIAAVSVRHYRKVVVAVEGGRGHEGEGEGDDGKNGRDNVTNVSAAPPEPTCLATIVAFDENYDGCNDGNGNGNAATTTTTTNPGDDEDDEYYKGLTVLAMGVGTKFLRECVLDEERIESDDGGRGRRKEGDSSCCCGCAAGRSGGGSLRRCRCRRYYGDRIRDCHAEVLTRRAFRRYVSEELLRDLKERRRPAASSTSSSSAWKCTNLPTPILERVEGDCTGIVDDDASSQQLSYRLRKGITLHFYCSSAPCGNAALKKFATLKRERFRCDLGPNEWPDEGHEYVPGHSVSLGQFALLVKKDNADRGSGVSTTPTETTRHKNHGSGNEVWHGQKQEQKHQFSPPLKRTKASPRGKGREAKWPMYRSDDWCPPGTAPVWANGMGSIHCCSDKLCRWNCLGLQGSLLSSWLDSPLYMATATVGRKLTAVTCRRALCCRVGKDARIETRSDDEHSESKLTSSRRQKFDSDATLSWERGPFRLNHPAILGTSVYMDETGVIDMTEKMDHGQDVRFHSSLSWAWWAGLEAAEVIDGSTGFLATAPAAADDANEQPPARQRSLICTSALTDIWIEMRRQLVEPASKVRIENPTALSDLRAFKQLHSPQYEQTKEQLLSVHPVLRQWKRRYVK